jgi:hypothetical protein
MNLELPMRLEIFFLRHYSGVQILAGNTTGDKAVANGLAGEKIFRGGMHLGP